ncbi:10601_t:CDS:2, partial [Funneliformis geosporum]
ENEFHELEDNLEIIDNKERDGIKTFPTGSIFRSDLKELDYTQYPLLISPIELYVGIKFHS